MPQHERIKKKFPALFAFGDHHQFLDDDGAVAATPEARIRSIWPFIVRRVLAFQRTLKARERVNFEFAGQILHGHGNPCRTTSGEAGERNRQPSRQRARQHTHADERNQRASFVATAPVGSHTYRLEQWSHSW